MASKDNDSTQHRAYAAGAVGVLEFLQKKSSVIVYCHHNYVIEAIKGMSKIEAHKDIWKEFFALRDKNELQVDAVKRGDETERDKEIFARLAKMATEARDKRIHQLASRPSGFGIVKGGWKDTHPKLVRKRRRG